MALAPKGAGALIGNVRVRLDEFQVAQAGGRSWEIFRPVEVASAFVGPAEGIGEGANGEAMFAENADPRRRALILIGEVGVELRTVRKLTNMVQSAYPRDSAIVESVALVENGLLLVV